MVNESSFYERNETQMRIALSEEFPESNFGAIPVVDRFDALEAYLAFDDGALAEAPQALAAYVTSQQHYDT